MLDDSPPVTGIVPVLGGTDSPVAPSTGEDKPAVAAAEAVGRVLAALKTMDKPADIETVAAEVNAGLETKNYLATGVIGAALDALVRGGGVETRETRDSPPRTVFAIAASIFVDKAEGLPVEARAAVVAVLGGNRAYVAHPDGTPRPEIEPESPLGGFDVSQVAFAIAFAARETPTPQIAIPAPFVTAFMESLDPEQPEPLEARATTILDALVATEPQLVTARPMDGEPTRRLYSLTAAGQVLFAEKGALALAEATMAPKPTQPSAEDRLAQLEQSHLEYQKRLVADYNKAIAQCDKALTALAERDKSLVLYREWFTSKNLADPDTLVATRSLPERKIVRGYTLEMALNVEEHFRLVRELDNADRAFAFLLEQQGETTAAMKAAKAKAESLVTALKSLVKLPADGRKNVVVKDVYKVVEDGRIAVYSADAHDDGALICHEPIPAGTQRVIASTGVPEVPAEPAPKKKNPEPNAAPAAPKNEAPSGSEPEHSTTAKEDGPDFSGVITTLLISTGPMAAQDIASKLNISVADVMRGIGASCGKVKQNGDLFEVPKPPKKAKGDAPAKSGGPKRTSLDPETIDKNIHDLLGHEPHSRTGILRGAFAQAYCDLVELKRTDSLERLLLARLDLKLKSGSVAQGEGGDDVLVWRADLDDPRLTDADRQTANDGTRAGKAERRGRGPDKQPRKKRGEGKASASA